MCVYDTPSTVMKYSSHQSNLWRQEAISAPLQGYGQQLRDNSCHIEAKSLQRGSDKFRMSAWRTFSPGAWQVAAMCTFSNGGRTYSGVLFLQTHKHLFKILAGRRKQLAAFLNRSLRCYFHRDGIDGGIVKAKDLF